MGTVPWNLGAQGGLSPDILGLRGLSPNILGFQWDHLLISWGSGALSPNILGLREDCSPVFLGWGCHPPIFWWLQEDRPPIFGAEGGPSPDIFISGCTVPQYFGTGGTVPCSTPACALGHRRGLSWHPRTGKGPVPWCPTTRRGTRRGNPVLKFIRNVPWEFGDVVPDYVLGQSTCALFLSLRYHHLNPGYIHDRLRHLGRSYGLQLLLLQVDVKDPHQALKELAKICILADCTLLLAWR
uniref:ERCC1-like central domain-containing protein n=1 Tax=Buteo japonicus TaxID=224669 RepID=A0A8C0AVH4_9AVES